MTGWLTVMLIALAVVGFTFGMIGLVAAGRQQRRLELLRTASRTVANDLDAFHFELSGRYLDPTDRGRLQVGDLLNVRTNRDTLNAAFMATDPPMIHPGNDA